jgi:hypothetical protein
MDDGAAPVANTPYYVFIIRKDSDGSIDALFSLSATAPTMPAGYTYKRRFMSVHTDAAANIRPFTQTEDEVKFKTPVNDYPEAALASTNRIAYALSVPPLMRAIITDITYWSGAAANHYFWIDDANRVDAAASVTNCDAEYYASATFIARRDEILTNASRQIYARGTNVGILLHIMTRGWIDDRGRDA